MRQGGIVLGMALAVGGANTARASEAVPSPEPSQIYGGAPVGTCAWPATVSLGTCTGTLIHPEIVVYAAHCGDGRERVWFGEDVSSGDVVPGQGFSVETEYCKVNPAYPGRSANEARANDYAFCKLAEPVLDVPIVPALMGCETTLLLSGTPVMLVGYGQTDDDTSGVKHAVESVLHYIDDWGAAVAGGEGRSTCYGDSGGPAFLQMPDGTWRAFGIVSGPNVGGCGDTTWFATIHGAIPFIEDESGIDVSACHYANGDWNPSPACREFPLAPGEGSGKSWADACGGGVVSEWSSTCGPAFDPSPDAIPPEVLIRSPQDRVRIDPAAGDDDVLVVVEATASDVTSGVRELSLSVDGEVLDGSALRSPPWSWQLRMPPGIYELEVSAVDWLDNRGESPPVVIGIDRDPPPVPEASSTGPDSGDASTTAESHGSGTTSSGDEETSSTGDAPTTGSAIDPAEAADGCTCRSNPGGRGFWATLLLVVGRRRRRWAAGR